MPWIEERLQSFWLRIAASASLPDQELGLARILTGLFLLAVELPTFSWISEAPQGFFDPPAYSFGAFFSGFPSRGWLVALDLAILACILMLTCGVRARPAGISLFFLLTIGTTFRNSFGKIDHTFMLISFLLVMSFTNWGVRFSLVPDPPVPPLRQSYAMAVLACLLSFGMLSAGMSKCLHWLDFDPSEIGFLGWFYAGYFNYGHDALLAPYVFLFPPSFFELFDYLAIVFQMSAFPALWAGRKWWLAWLFTASGFHLANALILNIPFASHLPVYLSFCAIALLWKGWSERLSPTRVRSFSILLVLVTLIWESVWWSRSGVFASFSETVLNSHQHLILITVLWATLLGVILATVRAERSNMEKSSR